MTQIYMYNREKNPNVWTRFWNVQYHEWTPLDLTDRFCVGPIVEIWTVFTALTQPSSNTQRCVHNKRYKGNDDARNMIQTAHTNDEMLYKCIFFAKRLLNPFFIIYLLKQIHINTVENQHICGPFNSFYNPLFNRVYQTCQISWQNIVNNIVV